MLLLVWFYLFSLSIVNVPVIHSSEQLLCHIFPPLKSQFYLLYYQGYEDSKLNIQVITHCLSCLHIKALC